MCCWVIFIQQVNLDKCQFKTTPHTQEDNRENITCSLAVDLFAETVEEVLSGKPLSAIFGRYGAKYNYSIQFSCYQNLLRIMVAGSKTEKSQIRHC